MNSTTDIAVTEETIADYLLNHPEFFERHAERSEEHTSELQSPCNLVCRLLLEKKKKNLKEMPPITINLAMTTTTIIKTHTFFPSIRPPPFHVLLLGPYPISYNHETSLTTPTQ